MLAAPSHILIVSEGKQAPEVMPLVKELDEDEEAEEEQEDEEEEEEALLKRDKKGPESQKPIR